jgi:AcrR family transcriptional regulator
MPTVRRRRSPETARSEAVAAARDILLEAGPVAVTLKAVAARLGMSHGNLLHHFGSAGELQSALMASMVTDLTQALETAVAAVREGAAEPGAPVDIVFKAFAEGGAAKLAAWLALNDETRQLSPIGGQIRALVSALEAPFRDLPDYDGAQVRRLVLNVANHAFAEALMGPELRGMLDLPQEAVVRMAKDPILAAHPWTKSE